jgi:hypothetical protein
MKEGKSKDISTAEPHKERRKPHKIVAHLFLNKSLLKVTYHPFHLTTYQLHPTAYSMARTNNNVMNEGRTMARNADR